MSRKVKKLIVSALILGSVISAGAVCYAYEVYICSNCGYSVPVNRPHKCVYY